MSGPIKANSNTIELTVDTSCYCVLDLLCETMFGTSFSVLHSHETTYYTQVLFQLPLIFLTMLQGAARQKFFSTF